MAQTAGYPGHVPHFSSYSAYQTPPRTPYGRGDSSYYSARHYTPPTSGHTRRATNDGTFSHSYATPQTSYYSRPPEYSSPSYYASAQQSAPRRSDYVPIYTTAAAADPTPKSSARPRRSSYTNTSKPARPTPPPPRPRTSTAHKPPPKATEDDARRADIPAGYSIKNWDPTEEPILLLGSVFDANSLGKWIYDWTVFYYGPATPMSGMAGDLWLLLIQLAGKIKRAEECMPTIRRASSHDMVDDFLESGERLWQRFNKLLKICENYMWKAARKEAGASGAKKVTMGQDSGCEFVDSIFGRHRELERTEKLMTGIRLWSMRFDANCEDILRHPTA
ncbi:hypothetical protein BAUCODRAFT_39003 [Baudoinia panamericana UAMH 10762]|uniref:Vegetative cell wall protein gp1 n=1 Tax=Baudoinia panamericana (strain UAMH 10762) TaxID=717646 RepID=M2MKK0_BAUPA|nr:uncharacterized protein BAUCODRAFT_39003 [Baudoinia panamericana UAMH 10762]EMC91858.1 hypothetical protein BAUCODRAFT_39003 [Baudoinia panamericana UAMH 10762]